jgi:hypothetical protein
MNYKISEKTLVAVVNYLYTQPYKEVVGIIDEIRRVEEIKSEEKEEDTKEI